MKKKLFILLVFVISTTIPAITINYLWGSSASNIDNIPLFILIVLLGFIGSFWGGTLLGEYIKLNYLS